MCAASRLLFSVLTVMLWTACQPLDTTDDSLDPSTDDRLLEHIESLGFPSDSIEDRGDHYLVEGDILFSKHREAGQATGFPPRQAFTGDLVNNAAVTNITVLVDPSIPTGGVDDWRNEIQQAINDWNTVGSTRLHFSFTVSLPADIIIRSDAGALQPSVIAAAEFPSGGHAGFQIRINLDFNNHNISSGQKRYNMVHELGHTIGLRHTNWSARLESPGTPIPGTPCTDSQSVMNGGTANSSWSRFSFYDIEAVRGIYPIFRPAGVAPLLRYYNQGTGDHFYTIFFGELGCGGGGYVSEGTAGYVFQTQQPNTLPIYRYWNGQVSDHFYTFNQATYPGYVLESIAGYAFASQTPDNIPIFQYFHSGLQDHFYTQFGTNAAGYVLQGVAWYAVP